MRYLSVFLSIFFVLPMARAQFTWNPMPSAIRGRVTISQEALTSRSQFVLNRSDGTTVTPIVILTSTTQIISYSGLPLDAQDFTYRIRTRINASVGIQTTGQGMVKTQDCLDLRDDIKKIAPDATSYAALLTAIGVDPNVLRQQQLLLYRRTQTVLAAQYDKLAQQARDLSVP